VASVEKTFNQIASDKTGAADDCYAHVHVPDPILDPGHMSGKGRMVMVSSDIANIYSFN
jgi:hypothetical protein